MNSHVEPKKWQTLSLFAQMGNIGSEVGRALRARELGHKEKADSAYRRALELIDLTAEQNSNANSSLTKEVLRAREQFSEAMESGQDLGIEQYFMNFAIAERLRQFK